MTRRSIALLLVAALLLGACSPRKTEEKVPQIVTLNIGANENPAMDSLIGAFQERYPHIRVKKTILPFGEIGDARARDLVAKGELDLIESVSDVAYRPLEPFIQKSRFPVDGLNPPAEQLRRNGVLTLLPLVVTPQFLFYNVDRFEQAGIPLPREGWTWDQFRIAAARLAEGEGESRRWGFFSLEMTDMVRAMVEEETGRSWEEADEAVLLRAVQFFAGLIFTERAAPPEFIRGGGTMIEIRPPLTQMGAAMVLNRGESISELATPSGRQLRVDVAPLPSLTGRPPAINNIGLGGLYGIPQSSKHPEEAWLLLSFMAGPEGARIVASQGSLPLYRDEAVRKAWFDQVPAPPPGTEVFFAAPMTIFEHKGDSDWRVGSALWQQVQLALAGKVTAEEAVAQFLQERKQVQGR